MLAISGIAVPPEEEYCLSMPTVTLKLQPDEYLLLEQEARRRGITKSAIMRDALKHAVRRDSQCSIADQMRDLIGSAEGPADFASNPKYLQGYGRRRPR